MAGVCVYVSCSNVWWRRTANSTHKTKGGNKEHLKQQQQQQQQQQHTKERENKTDVCIYVGVCDDDKKGFGATSKQSVAAII